MTKAAAPIDKFDDNTRYPGGKGTFFQRIINLMPPHRMYLETHVGGGAVMRHKRPAAVNVALDLNPKVRERWANGKYMHVIYYQADAMEYLAGIRPAGDILIYCDPPYMMEARKGGRLYDHEYSVKDHERLLAKLKSLHPCKIIVSGYLTELYISELKSWSHISFEVMTRGGLATEFLWFNFPFPQELHEYTYLGDTFRDRERIKRKRKRWIKNLKRMPELDRNAMLDGIRKEFYD